MGDFAAPIFGPTTLKRTPPHTRRSSLKKAERDLIARDILDLFPNLIIVVSDDGTIVEVNKHARELLKADGARLHDASVYNLCKPDAKEELTRAIRNCLAAGSADLAGIDLSLGNGTELTVDMAFRRYPANERSKDCCCVVTLRDVSEEKKKELDLLRFSNVAHYTVNPVEITGIDGKIIYVNPAFEKASGYTKEEVIGKNPNIFGSGKLPKSFWKKMWDTIKEGKVWVGEIENRRRNGEPFFTQLLISPIVDGDAKVVGYFGVHRDIGEQKYLQQQLVHAQKMESIGLLAAGIAHEVGNPLTSISSLVQVIQRTTHDEFTQEKLELIKSQINRISRTIRDLVDFSRRSSYEVQLTDVNKSIRESVEIVRVGRKAKDILFEVDLKDSIPQLPLVPDQIEQVFINILINAVDAIQARFRDLPGLPYEEKGKIAVKSEIRGEHVMVTIQDNGRGMSEETLPKIFEAFFTTKNVGEGTGLGLWVSYGIIRSFQGNINVESTVGQGTRFTISLPLHPDFITA